MQSQCNHNAIALPSQSLTHYLKSHIHTCHTCGWHGVWSCPVLCQALPKSSLSVASCSALCGLWCCWGIRAGCCCKGFTAESGPNPIPRGLTESCPESTGKKKKTQFPGMCGVARRSAHMPDFCVCVCVSVCSL